MNKKNILFGACCCLAIAGIITSGVCIAKDVESNSGATVDYVKFSYTAEADVSWFNGEDKQAEYVLNTGNELLGLSLLSSLGESFDGVTIKLGSDISFNDDVYAVDAKTFKPIKQFSGVFDGQGHILSNIKISEKNSFGFFSVLKNATINDLTIENALCEGLSGGVIASSGRLVNINNVSVKNADIIQIETSTDREVGIGGLFGSLGIVSTAGPSNILDNCSFDGKIQANTTGHTKIGGLISSATTGYTEDFLISNCRVDADIFANYEAYGLLYVASGRPVIVLNNEVNLNVEYVSGYTYSYKDFSGSSVGYVPFANLAHLNESANAVFKNNVLKTNIVIPEECESFIVIDKCFIEQSDYNDATSNIDTITLENNVVDITINTLGVDDERE